MCWLVQKSVLLFRRPHSENVKEKKKSCQYKSSWCFRGSAGGTVSLLLSLWALLGLLYFSRLASLSRFLTSCIAVTQMGELSNAQERFKVLLKSAATRRNRPQEKRLKVSVEFFILFFFLSYVNKNTANK